MDLGPPNFGNCRLNKGDAQFFQGEREGRAKVPHPDEANFLAPEWHFIYPAAY
jgi:hypothetical protein